MFKKIIKITQKQFLEISHQLFGKYIGVDISDLRRKFKDITLSADDNSEFIITEGRVVSAWITNHELDFGADIKFDFKDETVIVELLDDGHEKADEEALEKKYWAEFDIVPALNEIIANNNM